MLSKEKQEIISRLNYFAQKGVQVYLEGKLTTPEEVAEQYFVAEDCVYMPDYVLSDKGQLKEVRYDKVKQKDIP
ncbi:MAG: hypothetical protein IJX86_04535 [Lachnospiraceae bacterium]|nr:hypothetical protein [Lachnospiraceae bacterium]MBR3683374.1 hypothetical protein [Lachnospiraceae bacterium]